MNSTSITLEEHRSRTIGEILGKLKQNDRVCCVRYTGYGKTYYLIKRLIEILPDKKFIVFVPAKSLIKGYKKIFQDYDVIIKTYQSLLFMKDSEIEDNFSNIDYIICDEVHRLGRNKWRQSIINAFDIINNGKTKIIGFTATPERGDMINVVEDFFDGIETSRFDLLDGIQAGYTPKIDYVVAYCDLSGLDKEIYDERMEDVDRYEIDKLLNVSNILRENISKNKLKENLKVVLYISRLKDIDTAKESCYKWFTEAFPNKNIKIFSLSSDYTDKENNNYLNEYSDDEDNNSIDIMISCNKLNEGLHLPKCSIAILLRRTTSPIVYFQQIGRAINGNKPVIFDLVDNSSHIRQIENDFECGSQNNLDLSIKSNKDKKIFSECINLISKTKEIEDVLNKFKHWKEVPDDIRAEIAKDNNLSIAEIANKYKINRGTVVKILKENNCYNGKPLNIISNDDLIKIINKNKKFIEKNIQNGITLEELCSRLNLKRWHLLRGLDLCNIGCENFKKFTFNDDVCGKVIDLYNQNKSCTDISNELEITVPLVRRILYNMGEIENYLLSDDDKKFIKNNFGSMTIKQLSIALDFGYDTVRDYLRSIKANTNPRKATQEDIKYICKLYTKENKSIQDIHKITNKSSSYISRILHSNHINVLKRRKKSINDDEVCLLYKKLKSYTKVAQKLHCNRELVKLILNNNNIEMKKSHSKLDLDEDSICSDYLRIKSAEKVGDLYNISGTTVRRVLDRNNVKAYTK